MLTYTGINSRQVSVQQRVEKTIQQYIANTTVQSSFDLLGETVGKSKALVQGSTKRFGALLASAMRKRVDKEEVDVFSSRSGVFATELVEVRHNSKERCCVGKSHL